MQFKAPFLSLLGFLLMAHTLLALKPNAHEEVAIRQIGHRLLQNAGDSNSRVLPVHQVAGDYTLEFSSPLSIFPDSLVAIVEQVIAETDLPSHYYVTVQDCAEQLTVYSFERAPWEEGDVVPCLGRTLEENCYLIHISFPDLVKPNLAGSSQQVLWFWILGIAVLLGLAYLLQKRSRKEAPEPEGFALGKFRFSPKTLQLSLGDSTEDLSAKETDLLALLLKHKNQTLERALILESVWGDDGDYVGRTLDVFISKLRKKLEADPEVKIVNARGVGYRLVLP